MTEFFLAFPTLFSSQMTQLGVMFASAFVSATVLPANSEIVFNLLAAPKLLGVQADGVGLFWLWLTATLGNTLGGLTSFQIGKIFTRPSRAKLRQKRLRWALLWLKKYGSPMLFFSWLPIVGDVLCVAAGWLRFPSGQVLTWLLLGKGTRYAVLAWALFATLR